MAAQLLVAAFGLPLPGSNQITFRMRRSGGQCSIQAPLRSVEHVAADLIPAEKDARWRQRPCVH